MKIAKVVANPFCAIDADGIPQGVVGVPGARNVWIGARLDQVASERTGKSRFYFPRGKDGGRRVVEVNVSDSGVRGFIARCVNEGELLAADEETARCFGIPRNLDKPKLGYLPVEEIFAIEKARALDGLKSLYGKDAKLGEIPEEESAAEIGDVRPPEGKTVRLDGTISLIKPSTERQ